MPVSWGLDLVMPRGGRFNQDAELRLCLFRLGIKLYQRQGPGTVPVGLKIGGHVLRQRPQHQNIAVPEVQCRMLIEVLIPDVPAPGNTHKTIHHKGFVVHAPVDAIKVSDKREPATESIPGPGWIEYTHTDIGMGIQQGEQGFLASNINVIQQQANHHPAISGRNQTAGQVTPTVIIVPDVILGVDALVGGLDQSSPGQKGILACVQQLHRRQPGADPLLALRLQKSVWLRGDRYCRPVFHRLDPSCTASKDNQGYQGQ